LATDLQIAGDFDWNSICGANEPARRR
jgi:hypothetical protein